MIPNFEIFTLNDYGLGTTVCFLPGVPGIVIFEVQIWRWALTLSFAMSWWTKLTESAQDAMRILTNTAYMISTLKQEREALEALDRIEKQQRMFLTDLSNLRDHQDNPCAEVPLNELIDQIIKEQINSTHITVGPPKPVSEDFVSARKSKEFNDKKKARPMANKKKSGKKSPKIKAQS